MARDTPSVRLQIYIKKKKKSEKSFIHLAFVLLLTGVQCLACSRQPPVYLLWLWAPVVASAI